jgi:hypothetical protein
VPGPFSGCERAWAEQEFNCVQKGLHHPEDKNAQYGAKTNAERRQAGAHWSQAAPDQKRASKAAAFLAIGREADLVASTNSISVMSYSRLREEWTYSLLVLGAGA